MPSAKCQVLLPPVLTECHFKSDGESVTFKGDQDSWKVRFQMSVLSSQNNFVLSPGAVSFFQKLLLAFFSGGEQLAELWSAS